MKKLLLSFAVASALGLTGCGGGESLDDIKDDTETGGQVQVPLSRVVFDPSAGTLSVPNDLLLQGTNDGTLYMPGEKSPVTGAALAAPNYADPSTALGALDGWSTQNPFSISLSFASGVSLDAATASMPGSVMLVEAVMGDPMSSDPDCRAVPRGVACKPVKKLTFGVDYISKASGNSVAVIPLKPLKSNTTYILVLTDQLKDSDGRSIAGSVTYELVRQDIATKPLGSAAQLALQGVINSFENVVSTQSINKDSIIYTAAITTQSVQPVFATIKGLMGQTVGTAASPVLSLTNTGLTVAQASPQLAAASPLFQMARLYTGTVNLPYYLGTPTEANPTAPLNVRWSARCDSGAIIGMMSDAQKTDAAAKITDPAQAANDAFCDVASKGQLRDFGLDTFRHLTKFNVIPKVNSVQNVPVQVTVPDETLVASLGVTKPAAGWPVVILQHGITSRKEDMLAITGALSARGFATVAIDHPLHGARGFAGSGGAADINATTHSATDYMNLSNLLVTRDNLRQSIADILGLRLGMNFNNQPGLLNTQDVQFLGISLGSISGVSAVAMANSSTGNAQLDALYKMRSAALSVPGGAIANFLLESATFSPTIKASVLLGAGGTTAQNYVNFAEAQGGCGAAAVAPYAACFTPFVQYLTSTGNTAAVAALNAAFTQFAFAAQTVTDSGDPNNFASTFVATATPAYINEVVGNGADSLSDQVIPNKAEMPLAGTEPLARLLGATAVNNVAGTYPVTGTSLSRFIAGEHGSLLRPTVPAVTTEMQTQTVSFLLSRGAGLSVANGAVMAPAN